MRIYDAVSSGSPCGCVSHRNASSIPRIRGAGRIEAELSAPEDPSFIRSPIAADAAAFAR